MSIDHAQWAAYLLAGVDDRREVAAITGLAELSLDDAYAVQAALLELHLARGDSVAGAKLGLTSEAKQAQMGVSEPCYGWVLSSSLLGPDGQVAIGELIHPRCEPELVFRIGQDLAGPGISAADVLDATAEIVGGIEVIDSRYEAFSFTLTDVIADNTSAARMAVGTDGIKPGDADAADIACTFSIDGEAVGTATGAALLGSPAECVAMLANHLGRHGQKLSAGWVVPAGAPTDAKPLAVGTTAVAAYDRLGSVTITGV